MRWTCLSLLVACGGPSLHGPPPPGQTAAATAATATPPATATAVRVVPAPPAPPALPTFASPGELYMVTAAGGAARCEAWAIDPERRVLVSKQDARELAFEVTGKALAFTELARLRDGETEASSPCSTRLPARETEAAIVLDGAKLYRTAAACGAAVAGHERVALKLDCALPEPAVPARAQQATRAKLEGLLARGGMLYTIVDGPDGDACRAVRVSAARPGPGPGGWLGGSFDHDVVRDDGVKGTTSLSYQMQRGSSTITFLGPGTTWRDGSAQAFG